MSKIIENQAHCARIRTFCDAMQEVCNETITKISETKDVLAVYSSRASIATGRGEEPSISEINVQKDIINRFIEIQKFFSVRPSAIMDSLPMIETQLKLFENVYQSYQLDAHRDS
jgi:hypothetical protein